MSNARGKHLDKTFLSIDQAESRGFIHRDYIAHCFRWSHVVRQLMKGQRYKTAKIMDIGCGRELPFAKLLYSSKMIPVRLHCVDAGPILPDHAEAVSKGKMQDVVQIYPETIFGTSFISQRTTMKKAMTDLVCFEVIEHVEPYMLHDMLNAMHDLLVPGLGRLWISTPCWDRKSCAANHVNEMRYDALGRVFIDHGFQIENVHGTFASISDYRDQMNEGYREVFDDLRDYYDSNVLSIIFAPMFPAYARNCLWELRTRKVDEEPTEWLPWADCSTPWGSSEQWREMCVDTQGDSSHQLPE